MSYLSEFSQSQEYLSFRSSIPLRKIVVDNDSSKVCYPGLIHNNSRFHYTDNSLYAQVWKLYDSGPKNVTSPLICLPPVSGTADIFFKQSLALNAKGYRLIAVRIVFYLFIQMKDEFGNVFIFQLLYRLNTQCIGTSENGVKDLGNSLIIQDLTKCTYLEHHWVFMFRLYTYMLTVWP